MNPTAVYKAVTWSTWYIAMPLMRLAALSPANDNIWLGRMGTVSAEISRNSPWDIWIHAVSVGEAGVANAIIREIDQLRPGLKILLSVSTPTGIAHARKLLGERCGIMFSPLDFPQPVSKAVQKIRPRVYACLETELWPNTLSEMTKQGIKTILLNGRISARSFPRYQKIRPITARLLQSFTIICASSLTSASRLKALGAPDKNIILTGNAKYQALVNRPDTERAHSLRKFLKISRQAPVIVAGSIRSGEEGQLLRAWEVLQKEYPALRLIVAPRHLENVPALKKLFSNHSSPCTIWSRLEKGSEKPERVIIVDAIGKLFDLYGIASAAFVGGSLVPKGGQNMLEPAAWGCPVFYGPFTDNFEDAVNALKEEGADGRVSDGNELAVMIKGILDNPSQARITGTACRNAVIKIAANSATRQAETLLSLLPAN